LSSGSLETSCGSTGNQFGLCILSLGNEDLSASVVNLCGSDFVSHTDEQTAGLLKVLVRLFQSMNFAQYVADVVLDVSAKDDILGKCEMFICNAVFLDRALKNNHFFFDAAPISSRMIPS